MSKIEILAPVGSEEMLRAAVFSGADAVYLGFSGFNARTGAGNFDADSLKEAVRFCHARGVAVHVALNTTVYGGELAGLADAVRAVAASGADAVICQDLAVAKLIGDIAPQLPRHGSTQMSVHTLQGALELKELGFARVVLARELSLPEVEHITKHCGIETECFVHGALCMCVSGQCYMSAFLGGRSGNRGSCAGPCRLPFEANALPEGKPGRLHHLSLKDNSVIDKLDKLQAIGVASAKIEGRLRTPEYVAAAVSACLAGREGRAYDRDLLKNAFSRSGFTSGYLDGKIDGTMFGVRSEADAELTRKTLPALRELYRRERSRVPVEMKIEIEEGGEKLTVTDGTNKAFAYGDAEPQPARTDPTESLSRSLSKTGGTPFSAEKIDVEMDGGPWFVPGSAINELRREALDALLKKREILRPWPVNEVELPPLPLRTLPPHRTLRARFERWEQVPEQALSGVEYLILPIAQADRVPREWREKTLLELPRVMFGALEEDTARRIAATQDAGFAGYEVSNIAHLRLCRGLPMTGGFGLNVTNNLAAQYYADLGLRSVLILPEVKDSDISTIAPTRDGKPVPTGVITYGHMPLMVTRACPLQNIHDCAHCDKTGTLTEGLFEVREVHVAPGVNSGELLGWVASAERTSIHPVARAVVQYAEREGVALLASEGAVEIAGHGIRAEFDGKQLLVGNTRLMARFGVEYPSEVDAIPETIVVCALDGRYAGYLVIADKPKEDAARAVAELKSLGIEDIRILSGDREALVANLGRRLGVSEARGDLLPEGKMEILEALRGEPGKVTAFVGDGFNDAPALATSDVGVAMGALGSDAAIETADVVIQSDQPSRLPAAIRIGRLTHRIVRQNILLAIGVKVVVLTLGALGIATMWEAVFADVGVTLLAVLNAVRASNSRF